MNLIERVEHVEARIAEACAKSGRRRDDIQVIAVTKYVSTDTAIQVARLGLKHLGENRWPDAKEKVEQLQDGVVWHFIGRLQSRKVAQVLGKFQYIHSLDRLSLADEIEKRAAPFTEPVRCFVQVNVSGEETKAGLTPQELPAFIEKMNEYNRIRVVGLMTMAPYVENPEETRPVFRQLKELRDKLNEENRYREPIPHLSMGMSNDFEVAIEEGATWIRLGSVLVGNDTV
jgi:pyridoxal phosphate enzyme (YggS family)